MVQAMVDIDKHSNQVLNIVKAKHGLSNKSEAIDFVVQIYEQEIMEPELRPEYVKKALKISKEKSIRIKNIDEYFKKIEKED